MSEKGESTRTPPGGAMSNLNSGKDVTSPPQTQGEHSRKPGVFSRLGIGWKTTEQERGEPIATGSDLMVQRWGPPENSRFEMVMRYWLATRMQQHWEYLRTHDPENFRHYMEEGYMEPIPTAWVESRHLARFPSVTSNWETRAEKRLYYLLDFGVTPDGTAPNYLVPLRRKDDIIARGKARQARRVRLDAGKVAVYQSPGDVFHSDKQIISHSYSAQVPNVVSAAREAAMIELADGIRNGTDHLETMLLVDTSSARTHNPHEEGHDQPCSQYLVEHLLCRVLKHMIPRSQKGHPDQKGIDTVAFSTTSKYIGQLSIPCFAYDGNLRSHWGGSTHIMQGWQLVKNTYFDHQQKHGHGRLDPEFGWQATPGMPKLSLLVFLFGEADDMDEFELELLGQTWAYVTIALVGMENCLYHHSHAAKLERVAQFNPRVGFYDMHGRVCERMVVKDVLSSVYPVDPPQQSEILKPEFDILREKLTHGHTRVCERIVVEDSSSSVHPVDPPQYAEILKPEFDLPREDLPKYSGSQGRTCADK